MVVLKVHREISSAAGYSIVADMNDSDLLRQAQSGDLRAFTRLIDQHEAALRGIVAFYVAEPEAVLDILQDALLDAWQHIDRVDPTRPFGPWLRTLCRNRARKYLRTQSRTPAQSMVDVALLAAEPTVIDRRGDALAACLESLDDGRRQLLEDRFVTGARIQDLAERSGKSANAISMQLLRVKDLLRGCIERRMEEA